jgi:hypothetical protein
VERDRRPRSAGKAKVPQSTYRGSGAPQSAQAALWVGQVLVAALGINKSVVSLELGHNRLGAATCLVLYNTLRRPAAYVLPH